MLLPAKRRRAVRIKTACASVMQGGPPSTKDQLVVGAVDCESPDLG
jgi:hypothetical protein